MIGRLPTSLEIGNRGISIQSDFRIALLVFQAFNDPEVPDRVKPLIAIDMIIGMDNLSVSEYQEAYEKVKWFLDGGTDYSNAKPKPKTMDWEQDEQLIFSAVNHVAGKEIRELPYLHWWTFLGYFNEIREGLFSSVLMIRQKMVRNKKLEKWEKEYYAENKDLINFHTKRTEKEKQAEEELNQIFI